MNAGRPGANRIYDLFNAALELPPEERVAFLDEQSLDPQYRAKLDGLLAADAAAQAGDEGRGMPEPAGKLGLLVAESLARPRHDALRKISTGDTIADCRLLQELGSGSFARVFLAEQTSMRRLVALKISTRRSLEPELLARLTHPHIVRVHHYEDRERVTGGLCLLYMQHVSGCTLEQLLESLGHGERQTLSGRRLLETLEEHLARRGMLDRIESGAPSPLGDLDWPGAVCWIGARLAHALHYAHGLQVRHRDVKPANVLLARDGSPMLLDFNVSFGAHIEGARPEDNFGGSLAYMSPEQLDALHSREGIERLNESSDVYSLGVVLWEMLGGAPPFLGKTLQGATTLEIAAKLRDASQRDVMTPLPPTLPRHLDQLLRCCLTDDPAQRPTAISLARRLHLYSLPQDPQILFPPIPRWEVRCLATCAYILIFILANGLLTALSIEHQLQFTVSDGAWDTDYLLYPEAPVVIAVCNLAGTAAIVGFAWPALKAVLRRRPEDDEDRLEANSWVGVRCLTIGAFAGVVVLVLWAVAGIALPAWNSWGGGASHVTWVGGVRFFIHHMVFATIAAPVTFVAVTLAIVHELFPPLIPFVGTPAARRAIPKVENLLTGSTTMLALTPYFGLLVLGLTNAVDSRFGLVVAAVGIGGAAFAHLAAPVIRSRLRLIDRALTPLEESMFSRK